MTSINIIKQKASEFRMLALIGIFVFGVFGYFFLDLYIECRSYYYAHPEYLKESFTPIQFDIYDSFGNGILLFAIPSLLTSIFLLVLVFKSWNRTRKLPHQTHN